jgi:hypothetical protein
MNDDIPWAYVAMIFIAFASWVFGRLKEAAEIRRARAEAKRAAQESRNRAQPVPAPSPYRPAAQPRQEPAPVPAPTPSAEIEVPKTFRELFEMLQEQAAPAPLARESERAFVPPPLPAPDESAEPVQSEADRIFYGSDEPVDSAPPLRIERVRAKTSSNLNRILKNRATLREALILKEILDTPVAMRE